MSLNKPYTNIPGTTIFDADQARIGYGLNQFCMSLMKPENREAFRRDEVAYMRQWPVTDAQVQAIVNRDFNSAIKLGGNIYFLAKLGFTDERNFQQMAGSMTGMTEEEYKAMMMQGGRSVRGNITLGEGDGDAQPEHQPQGSGKGSYWPENHPRNQKKDV